MIAPLHRECLGVGACRAPHTSHDLDADVRAVVLRRRLRGCVGASWLVVYGVLRDGRGVVYVYVSGLASPRSARRFGKRHSHSKRLELRWPGLR